MFFLGFLGHQNYDRISLKHDDFVGIWIEIADNQGLRMPLGVVLMAPMTEDIIRSEKAHLAT